MIVTRSINLSILTANPSVFKDIGPTNMQICCQSKAISLDYDNKTVGLFMSFLEGKQNS